QDAVQAATAVPAFVLGLSPQVGDLRAGMRADIVVADRDLHLAGVLRQGDWVTPLG
ncbi:MAG: amidohydrolase family protein, partial [Actinomycetes bacterium]